MYRHVWHEGPQGLEYGVELDTACTPASGSGPRFRVAVAGARPPSGCRANTSIEDIASRDVTWNTGTNTFTLANETRAIPAIAVAAIAARATACDAPCLALWSVHIITSHGAPAAWQVERTWVTPDTTNLCNSAQQTAFDILVARGSAAAPLALHPDGDGFDPDVFAVLEDDGGARVLVTQALGEYATWDIAAGRQARHVHYGFPNEEDFAGAHDLAPYCGP
jgi:hypothetical protein